MMTTFTDIPAVTIIDDMREWVRDCVANPEEVSGAPAAAIVRWVARNHEMGIAGFCECNYGADGWRAYATVMLSPRN
jgi:hypothetical protein